MKMIFPYFALSFLGISYKDIVIRESNDAWFKEVSNFQGQN
jgi:hypothetical protein